MALLTLLSSQSIAHVQQFTLDNGLKIVVKEDHRAPVVTSMIWYNVGSADEPGGKTGISHVLEHMMFKGTKAYPIGVFSKTIAEIGGQENAFTNTDYTAYFEKIAAEHLPTALKLEADRMQHLMFDSKEFAKEMKVIQEERRLRTDDNPQALTFERFLAAAHLTTPYHHPVIGWMTDLEHMNIEDVQTWYKRYYAPNNATLVVVGDVNPHTVYKLAKQYFGNIKSQPKPHHYTQTEPPGLGIKQVQVNTPAQVPLLMMGYTVPSVASVAPKKQYVPYALELIAGILDGGESGRFSEDVIRGKQVASMADVYYNLYARYQTQFVLYGAPSQNNTVDSLKQALLAEITRLQNQPISEEELQRVKTQLIAQKTFEKDSIFGQAMEIGLLETIGLGWQTSEKYIERIKKITPAQIQQTAQEYFVKDALTIAELVPQTPSKTMN